ncbi:MAG: radical SAM protein [Dehalococcoidales bacterium]|nr:radical SAM protein [Dehalococcoidales bacterium]
MQVESQPRGSDLITPKLQLVAWEITRSCNLLCAHCRASAKNGPYPDELSTPECFRLIDQIVEAGKPILILTGGEPLARPDIFDIGKYAVSKGLRVVMGSNGTLITREIAGKLKEIPLSRIAISLDFPVAGEQDKFRGKAGAFAAAMAGIKNVREAGMEVQINCTLTKMNAGYLDKLLAIALEVGAVAFHPFLLVPTGRGKGLESVELSPQEYEQTLNWIYDKQQELQDKIFFKPTDAPHYLRVIAQRRKAGASPMPSHAPQGHGGHPANAITRGCLAGTGFAFVSHQGIVQGCGYLNLPAGDVRRQTFGQIWNESPLFVNLRDLSNIKGKCGNCEYKRVCGGCRARAYETTGDYLAAEPDCIYQPKGAIHG